MWLAAAGRALFLSARRAPAARLAPGRLGQSVRSFTSSLTPKLMSQQANLSIWTRVIAWPIPAGCLRSHLVVLSCNLTLLQPDLAFSQAEVLRTVETVAAEQVIKRTTRAPFTPEEHARFVEVLMSACSLQRACLESLPSVAQLNMCDLTRCGAF